MRTIRRTISSLSIDDRLLIGRMRYVYHWSEAQIAQWWTSRAVQLETHDIRKYLNEPDPEVLLEADTRRERDIRLTRARATRRWRADRASLEALLQLIGPAAVDAAERGDTKELRALSSTYRDVVSVAKDLPDTAKRSRGVRSDILEAATDEEITERWRELV